MINISSEFTNYNYTFNRTLSSEIALPYNKENIEIGVNELANGYNFNTSLDYLQSNLNYLYSVSKYANPNLPKQYKGWLGNYIPTNQDLNVSIRSEIFTINNISNNVLSIPYFYITDKNNNVYKFRYRYNNNINPETNLKNGIRYKALAKAPPSPSRISPVM